jgi:hypothetical protein
VEEVRVQTRSVRWEFGVPARTQINRHVVRFFLGSAPVYIDNSYRTEQPVSPDVIRAVTLQLSSPNSLYPGTDYNNIPLLLRPDLKSRNPEL